MLNLKDGTLWQWDIGRKIIITVDEGSTIDRVQFYNGIEDHAREGVVEKDDQGRTLAEIPNGLLQYPNNLSVYLVTTTQFGVKTQEQITLVVNPRAKPEDYIFTDNEVRTYQKFVDDLEYLKKNLVTPDSVDKTVTEALEKEAEKFLKADTKDNTTTFTSNDAVGKEGAPLTWMSVDILASGEKHSSIFNKVSRMFQNVRFLWSQIGTTDISKLGNGTIKGAISAVDTKVADIDKQLEDGVAGIYIRIHADEQLIGQTLTITDGTTTYNEVVPATMELEVKVKALGIWTITNPVTGKVHELEINYYGAYDVDVRCYRRFTVIIDHSIADPEKCCTYADNAVGMTPGSFDWFNETIFKDLKNCVLVNGAVAYYLNKDNLAQKEDGSVANITTLGHDVMLEIPRMGYRIEWLDANRLEVSITDHPNDSNYNYDAFSLIDYNDCDKLYIGTYMGHSDGSHLFSSNGKKVTASKTLDAFRGAAKGRGHGYNIISFHAITVLQCLYTIFYKNLNSQSCVLKGYAYNKDYFFETSGTADTYGFMSEKIKASDPSVIGREGTAVKCFGIENLWGNYVTFVEGLMVDSQGNYLICERANNFNTSGTNYLNVGKPKSMVNGTYINRPMGTSKAGFLPNEGNGTDSTFYCDMGMIAANAQVALYGGYNRANGAGVFVMQVTLGSTHVNADTSARLMYQHRET